MVKVRAKRMQSPPGTALSPNGWPHPSRSGSERAGFEGIIGGVRQDPEQAAQSRQAACQPSVRQDGEHGEL